MTSAAAQLVVQCKAVTKTLARNFGHFFLWSWHFLARLRPEPPQLQPRSDETCGNWTVFSRSASRFATPRVFLGHQNAGAPKWALFSEPSAIVPTSKTPETDPNSRFIFGPAFHFLTGFFGFQNGLKDVAVGLTFNAVSTCFLSLALWPSALPSAVSFQAMPVAAVAPKHFPARLDRGMQLDETKPVVSQAP